ncbi:MAG: dTMP kinase [Gammaproteobacteria bacterium]|nr:MAG: dTMP kinase [Gammaproteobacteria bacterium]
MTPGLFITVEGIEGVGKTTNIQFISDWLADNQIKFIATREPGGTPFAEEIRELLLQPREEKVCDTAELLLMFAARAQHLAGAIKPALSAGEWVLCDRFTDATFAYQGGGRGLSLEMIKQLESLVQGLFRPDAVILLDVPVDVGLARASARSEPDRIESEKADFFEKVRKAYLDRAHQDPERYFIIDASQPLNAVQQQLAEVLTAIQQRAAAC